MSHDELGDDGLPRSTTIVGESGCPCDQVLRHFHDVEIADQHRELLPCSSVLLGGEATPAPCGNERATRFDDDERDRGDGSG